MTAQPTATTAWPRTLPPGLDAADLSAALAAVGRVVGDAWVVTDDASAAGTLSSYGDPFGVHDPDDPDAPVPSAVVLPASVEEVQGVLAVATDHGLPLSPVSLGRNLGYGGAAPRLPGAVVVDLRRMNRIREVDDRLGYAVVEPGVSFLDLAQHLTDLGVPFRADVPDLGWGSVVGNTLERGIGYTPYGDHVAAQCGMEVLLADGTVVRTGTAAMSGSRTAHVSRYGFGPLYDGLFTQSNFGIVTTMGVWLLPEPAGYRAYQVTLAREEDVAPLVELLRPLRLDGTVVGSPSLRSLWLDVAAGTRRADLHRGPGPIPDSVARRVMAERGLGWWTCYGAMYGPEAALDAQEELLRDVFSAIPGSRFHLAGEHDNPVLATRAKIMAGRPNLETAAVLDWVDNCGHIDFAPTLPALGEEVLAQYELERDLCHRHGTDFMGILVAGLRDLHHIQLLMFDTADPQARRRTRELCGELVAASARRGLGAYRANPAIMDQVAASYDFNDGAILRLSERVKDALDPAGILAPGKQGIWPRRLRGTT